MTSREPLNAASRSTVDAIVEATDVLISESGWEDLAIRDVAIRAGVRPWTVHRYFTDRQGLAVALVARDRGTYAYRLRAAGLAPNVVAWLVDHDAPTAIAMCSALDRTNRESAWNRPIGYLPAVTP